MTPEELKLLVKVPVSTLESVTGLQDGELLFYDTTTPENKLKKISVDTFNNLSKTAKPLKSTDPAPTIEGLYKPTTSGTYSNAGGLIAQSGYDTLFFFNGTTWSKSEFAYPAATQYISPFIGSTFPISGNAQRTYDNFIWELQPGQTATATDIPFDGSLIWRKLNTEQNSYNAKIYSSTVSTTNSSISIEGNDVYIITFNANELRVYKNDLLYDTKAATIWGTNFKSISSFLKNGIIHILIGSHDLSASDNGLFYLKFDIVAKTLIASTKLVTTENAILKSLNIVEFNSELYTAVSTIGIISAGVANTATSTFKVDLFKLTSNTWVSVSRIAQFAEIWNAKFTTETGIVRNGMGEDIAPNSANLYVASGVLYCNYYSNTFGATKLNIFTKKSTDNGVTWLKNSIQKHFRGTLVYGYSDIDGNANFITNVAISGTSYTLTGLPLKIFRKDGYNQFNTNLGAYFGADKFSILHSNGKLHITYTILNGSSRDVYYAFFTDETINNSLIPSELNKIKVLEPNSSVPIGLIAGDYFDTNIAGEYVNLKQYEIPLVASVFELKNINVEIGEEARIIFTGENFDKRTIFDNPKTKRNSNIIEFEPQRNKFFTKNGRIPVIVSTEKKTLLSLFDVRYTTGMDYDEIDIGCVRSLNGGKTWQNHSVVMKRPVGDGMRIHDAGLVVDRNKNSAQYGRIWAFGKLWGANVDPFNFAYWKANTDKFKFYSCYSDDDGLTWSALVEQPQLYAADTYHTSSGANPGITMKDGTLVQPMYWVYNNNDNKSGFIYKTPSGNWTIGDIVPLSGTNECQIIQLENGHLILNARNTIDGFRKVFELTSIGSGWVRRADLEVNLPQINGGCSESLIKYNDTYIFSQPTSYGTVLRKNVTVFYSYDLITWRVLEVVSPNDITSGGYSSLVVDNNYFGIAHEFNTGIMFTDLSHARSILR